MAMEARSPYGVGVGGKIRVAKVRRSTPYERPAVGRHASAGPQAAAIMNGVGAPDGSRKGTWLGSGLIGSASKFVGHVYSSLFRRRDFPLLITEGEKNTAEILDGQPEASPSAAEAESTEAGIDHGEGDRGQDDGSSKISEIESWMKRRIFPREEADRLIEILRSAVVDNGVETKKPAALNHDVKAMTTNQVIGHEVQPNNGPQSDAQRWREELTKARQEQKAPFWSGGFGKENGSPSLGENSEGYEGLDSSPVDLARAYMGERVTRVVGPTSRVTITREKVATPLRSSPYQSSTRNSMRMSRDARVDKLRMAPGGLSSVAPESPPVARSLGLPQPLAIRGIREVVVEDKLRTPLAPHTLSRLPPVSRSPPGSALQFSLGEGVKKRGSTALDDGGYSSGGPVRRTRQRSSLYSPSPGNGLPRRGGLGLYPPPPVRTLSIPPMDRKQRGGEVSELEGRGIIGGDKQNEREEERRRNAGPRGLACVPVQSSETARKILETLERMTPSPKGKSLEEELALVRKHPPTELTPSMINEHARRTMQTWEFPASHQGEEAGPSRPGLGTESSSIGGFPWKAADHSTEGKGKGKVPFGGLSVAPQPKSPEYTVDRSRTAAGYVQETVARSGETDAVLAGAGPTAGKGKGFWMSAVFEESLSDDEGRASNTGTQDASIPTTNPLSMVETATGLLSSDGTAIRSITIAAPVFSSPDTSEAVSPTADGNVSSSDLSPKNMPSSGSFTFPSSPPVALLEPPPTPKAMPSPSFSGFPPATTQSARPSFDFGTGSTGDKSLFFTVPSGGASGDLEAALVKPKFEFKSESKPEFAFSLAAAATALAPQPLGNLEPALGTSKAPDVVPNNVPTVTFGVSAPVSSPFPFASAAGTTSMILASTLSAVGAGAKPAFAGFPTTTSASSPSCGLSISVQSRSPAPSNIFGLDTRTSNNDGSSATPPLPSVFGTMGNASVASPPPTFAFGAPAAFGQGKSFFQFGSSGSTGNDIMAPSSQSAPSTSSVDADRPHKRPFPVFGQDASKSSIEASGAMVSSTTFGVTGSAPTMTLMPSPGLTSGGFSGLNANSTASSAPFSIAGFGQSTSAPTQGSSPVPAVSMASPFGLASSPSPSAPGISSATTASPLAFGSNPPPFSGSTGLLFGTGTSSTFGTGNANPPPVFGGASSAPSFGGSNATKSTFGIFNTDLSPQPSPPPSVFGSGFGPPTNLSPSPSPSLFTFGATSAATSSPFAFGAGAGSGASTSGFSFGLSSSSSASPFAFGSKSATSPVPQPMSVFGLGNSGPAFGSLPNGAMASDSNDQTNMEDSMAEEPPSQMVSVSPSQQQQQQQQQPPHLFGTASGSGFLFGSSNAAASPSPVFNFGGQSNPAVANAFAQPLANPFAGAPQQPGSTLDFAGGGFAVGSSGGDTKGNRKIFKAKRTGSGKRNK